MTDVLNRFPIEEIERMVMEAEEFAEEDAAIRRRVEALHELSTFVWQLKAQLSDPEGLGGKLSTQDKGVLREELKIVGEWLEEHAQSATTEEIGERLAGLQAVVNPITTRLYQQSTQSDTEADDGEGSFRHVEL